MMNEIKAIQMPIDASTENERVFKMVKSAIFFAKWLDAELHVLLASQAEVSAALRFQERLADETPADCEFRVEAESAPLEETALASIQRRRPDMVILPIEPHRLRHGVELAPWQKAILEKVEEPVLVVPYTMELVPFESIIVPIGGKRDRVNSALDLGLRLGSRLGIPVDVLHVSPSANEEPGVGQLGDEFYHEYPRMVDELISEACPMIGLRERSALRDFQHVDGESVRDIFKGLNDRERSLTIIEWQGGFTLGRPDLVKAILRMSRYPLLLIKSVPVQTSTLKLGDRPVAA